MGNAFDPYHKWLGIPPNEQPADHYRLLGIALFESDADVISNAADKQMTHVRSFQAGEHSTESQQLLNEISAARLCLLSAEKRVAYDQTLRALLEAKAVKLPQAQLLETEPAVPSVQVATNEHLGVGSAGRAARERSSRLPFILGVGAVALAVVVALIVWGGRTPDGKTQNSPGPGETATIGPGDQALDNPPPPPPPSVAAPDKAAGGEPSHDAPTENVAVPLGPDETSSAPEPSEPPAQPAPPAEPPLAANNPPLEPAATPKAKLPVPSSADQATVIKQLDDVYGLGKRRTDEQSVKLARELLALGVKTRDNPAERFALFRKAAELAGHGGDAALMLQAVDAIGADFDIDLLTAKGKMLKGFGDRAGKTPEIKSLIDTSRQYIDQAMAQGRYDLALGMAKLAYRACQRPEGREFRKDTFDRQRQVQQLYDEHQELQNALLAVEADPNDGEANLFLGRLYCFEQGDWQRGLPYLAKCSDAAVALIAEQDLAEPAESADQMKVADAWWDLAQTRSGDEKNAMMFRAGHWYKIAHPRLSSVLEKAKADKRLAEIAKIGRPKEWKMPKELAIDLPGGVTMEFVLIPAGEFLMGSSDAERKLAMQEAKAVNDTWAIERIPTEGPQHRVKITRPFYLGKYEVTQAQWQAVMRNNPSRFKDPMNPVEQVGWNDIEAFLAKFSVLVRRVYNVSNLSPRAGTRAAAGFKPVLPTEAQWEYACRAGTTTTFCFGDNVALLGEFGWFGANADGRTHPVGQKRPNAWGLYDMHGNIWEWCTDWWGKDYYAQSAPADPVGPPTGSFRVLRGSSWGHPPRHFRTAVRHGYRPRRRNEGVGFRLALVP